jgi:glutamine synthetase
MSNVYPKREAEAHAFLDANPDITSIHLIWTDICGVARGKILRRDELVPAWKDGRFIPISALVLDVTGQDVPETGLVFDEGDRDMLLWPVLGSLVRIPWMEEPTAQYLATVHDLDGTPHFADPRNALEAIVKRFQNELNMTPVGAVELEFFLMDRASALAVHRSRSSMSTGRSTTRPITCRTSMISPPSSGIFMPIARPKACRPKPCSRNMPLGKWKSCCATVPTY